MFGDKKIEDKKEEVKIDRSYIIVTAVEVYESGRKVRPE